MQDQVYGRLGAALDEHAPDIPRDSLRRVIRAEDGLFGEAAGTEVVGSTPAPREAWAAASRLTPDDERRVA